MSHTQEEPIRRRSTGTSFQSKVTLITDFWWVPLPAANIPNSQVGQIGLVKLAVSIKGDIKCKYTPMGVPNDLMEAQVKRACLGRQEAVRGWEGRKEGGEEEVKPKAELPCLATLICPCKSQARAPAAATCRALVRQNTLPTRP